MSVTLIGLLCTAIYLNWAYSNSDEGKSDTAKLLGEAAYVNSDVKVDDGDMFEEKRIERETAREKSLRLIGEILADDTADQATKDTAQKEKLKIANDIEYEATSETILKSKGFKDVLVTLTGSQAVVCINAESLIPTQVAQVQDVVSSTAGISPDEIKIVLAH